MWPDKSGTGNSAFQDASARMPFLLDGGSDAAVNGHGVVRFDGNQFLSITDSETLQWGTSDFGLYVVMRHLNGPAVLPTYAIVYGKWTDSYPEYPGFFMWANYPGSTGYATRLDATQVLKSDGGKNDGVTRLVGARKTGSNYELRLNSEQVDLQLDASVPDASAFNAPDGAAVIGGRPAATQQLHGDIAEIIAVKGTLTEQEQTALETYLKSKYGL